MFDSKASIKIYFCNSKLIKHVKSGYPSGGASYAALEMFLLIYK